MLEATSRVTGEEECGGMSSDAEPSVRETRDVTWLEGFRLGRVGSGIRDGDEDQG